MLIIKDDYGMIMDYMYIYTHKFPWIIYNYYGLFIYICIYLGNSINWGIPSFILIILIGFVHERNYPAIQVPPPCLSSMEASK